VGDSLTLWTVLETEVTEAEKQELQHHEEIIERGLNTFVDVGNALLAIRDGRLYRAEFDTFEDYCRDRWGMKRAHAYRMIEAATVIDNLSPIGDKLPATESQVRPLTSLEPDRQREAWTRAIETAPDSGITAAHVQSVVDEMLGKTVTNTAGSYTVGNNGVKTCHKCGQLWAADLDYCPYCHISPEARMALC